MLRPNLEGRSLKSFIELRNNKDSQKGKQDVDTSDSELIQENSQNTKNVKEVVSETAKKLQETFKSEEIKPDNMFDLNLDDALNLQVNQQLVTVRKAYTTRTPREAIKNDTSTEKTLNTLESKELPTPKKVEIKPTTNELSVSKNDLNKTEVVKAIELPKTESKNNEINKADTQPINKPELHIPTTETEVVKAIELPKTEAQTQPTKNEDLYIHTPKEEVVKAIELPKTESKNNEINKADTQPINKPELHIPTTETEVVKAIELPKTKADAQPINKPELNIPTTETEVIEAVTVPATGASTQNTSQTVSGEALDTLLDKFFTVYQANYESAFAPNTENFATVYQDAKDFVSSLYPAPMEVSEKEASADLNYAVRYNVNEYLWNQHQALEAAPASRSADAEAPVAPKIQSVAELNGNSYTGKNGAVVTIETKFDVDANGNIIVDPSTFDSCATLTIKSKEGKESQLTVTTEDLDVESFQASLFSLINTIVDIKNSVLEDFQSEIKHVDIEYDSENFYAGYYASTTNTMVFSKKQQINEDVLVHELAHAIDDVGEGGFISEELKTQFESWKEAVIEFCPDVKNNYALKNVNELFAEMYSQAHDGKSYHMDTLLEKLKNQYKKVTTDPNSTEHEKISANVVYKTFNYLVNELNDNLKEVRNKQDADRLGNNNLYGLNKEILNTLLNDKSMIKNFYELQQKGVIDKKWWGLKSFLTLFSNNSLETMQAYVKQSAKGKGQELQELANTFSDQLVSFSSNYTSAMQMLEIIGTMQNNQKETPQALKNNTNENSNSVDLNSGNYSTGFNDFNYNNFNFDGLNSEFNTNDFKIDDSGNNNYNDVDSNSSSPSPTQPTPEINLPDMDNMFETPDIGSNSNIMGVETTTDNYSISGNINDMFNNNTGLGELNTSLDNRTPNEKFHDAVNDATNKAIEDAYKKYGRDAEVTADVKTSLDENGNFKVDVEVKVKGVGVASINDKSENSSESDDAQSDSESSQDGKDTLDMGMLPEVVVTADKKLEKDSSLSDQGTGNKEDTSNAGWSGSLGQLIINNYGNSDGTLDTDSMTKDWANAGGSVYNYSGTAAQNAFSAIQKEAYDSRDNYGYSEDWSWTGFDVFSVGGNANGGGIVYNQYGQIDYKNSWFSFSGGGGSSDGVMIEPETIDSARQVKQQMSRVDRACDG